MIIFFKCFFIKLSNGETYLITKSRDPPIQEVLGMDAYI